MVLVLSGSLHADGLGMLQAGRQAAGRQRIPQDGHMVLEDGRAGKRQTDGSQDWGPVAQRRHCRDRPERAPDRTGSLKGWELPLAGLAIGWRSRDWYGPRRRQTILN